MYSNNFIESQTELKSDFQYLCNLIVKNLDNTESIGHEIDDVINYAKNMQQKHFKGGK